MVSCVVSGVVCGMDGPRSGMCPSLFCESGTYALSSYGLERTDSNNLSEGGAGCQR
ncbi:hypothetical protein SAM23877_2360 [Streptomyces ambofaciens ATCC 23877]|uniref:Uncharacterized protein n=1 Tax=Streptomyces ambofaciens (strain ATCC 23877 / 3486 / DSM 40053 / JCM 4204 / NBRC 12836 / NRRL B-2516) TaxID=278992 RepID=A0A0K2AQZ2_STRA7|nr:hypothetical protein SAM23877_2360 [Streptomyces ambofaciens ATCC 23877]